jgi:hypothetical protein
MARQVLLDVGRPVRDEGLRLPKGATLRLPAPDPDTGLYPFPGDSYRIEADGTVSDQNCRNRPPDPHRMAECLGEDFWQR